jgi:hypothetical protein
MQEGLPIDGVMYPKKYTGLSMCQQVRCVLGRCYAEGGGPHSRRMPTSLYPTQHRPAHTIADAVEG